MLVDAPVAASCGPLSVRVSRRVSGPQCVRHGAGCSKVQRVASQVTWTMPCCHGVQLPVRSYTFHFADDPVHQLPCTSTSMYINYHQPHLQVCNHIAAVASRFLPPYVTVLHPCLCCSPLSNGLADDDEPHTPDAASQAPADGYQGQLVLGTLKTLSSCWSGPQSDFK